MEVTKTSEGDNVVRDGENPSQLQRWVSPDVAAALAGETVDFSKHVTPADKDESNEN